MGEVWGATHTDGSLAAIKVLTRDQARTPEALRVLWREIEAVAGLDHPAVIAIFDAGTVDEAAAAASEGRLPAGSPWLAMERCSEGSLADAPPLGWVELRGLLLTLLDALGHVHGRGLIHRDLKPENVLLAGPTDLRPGWRLADFGIAHALDRATEGAASTGTPLYLAPEQARGERWRLGPPTDLYALGCIAWERACGRPHRRSSSLAEVVRAQASDPLPPLEPVLAVPDGLGAWIERLTQLEPGLRFASAAEAARALVALGEPRAGATTTVDRAARTPARTFALTAWLAPGSADGVEPVVEPAGEPSSGLPSWRLPSDEATAPRLGDAGLALLPWRAVPLVGRAAQQDALWQALADVIRERSPRLVWLHGPTGVGKSRLARWVSERAAELGLATPIAVRANGGDPLAAAVAATWGIAGQDAEGARRILRRHGVDADLIAALDAWWHGAGGTLADQTGLAAWRFAAMASRRPVVLWLDDVHTEPTRLRLCDRLQETGAAALIVVTTDDEPAAGSGVPEQLARNPWAVSLALGPLDGTDRLALVHAALGLEPALGAAVAQASAGIPGAAIALVHGLAARGDLQWSTQGFALRGGSGLPPLDPTGQWAHRLDAALDARPLLRRAIAAGAAVGPTVAPERWAVACDAAGVPAGPHDLEPLTRAALVVVDPTGAWSFTHPAARAAALAVLDEEARRAVHRALAIGDPSLGSRAEHLWQAGDLEAVLDPLVDAAERHMIEGQQKLALLEMERWSMAASQLRLELADPRRLRGLARLAAVRRQMGDLSLAEPLCHEVRALGEPGTKAFGQATAELGAIHGIRGDPERARGLLAEARDHFLRAGELLLVEGCTVSIATALMVAGQPARALELLDQVILVDERGQARLERARAIAALHLHDFEAAEAGFHRALALYRSAGNLHGIANAWNDLGACAMHRGDPDEALARFRAAEAQFEALGAYQATQAQINITQMLARRGAWAEVRAKATPLLRRIERTRSGDVALPLVVLLTAAAALGDWDAFDEHLAALGAAVSHAQHLEDLRLSADQAADEATRRGQPARAEAVRVWFAGVEARTRAGR